ncbi:hypothetical protein LTR70_008327 [Exophiala xenobiotica]|uniref:Uncharacterized protein n=1 Tax=Lithohypha guttulata TaxID=1690604 RepID=A0ABR0K1Q3_9EURO|nr:hypothetical protein LTR24_007905 [Lithohypha guttulata]KAK5312230.1 hypothetical protein LTR70_008327 [Exophiala xenobiotica]
MAGPDVKDMLSRKLTIISWSTINAHEQARSVLYPPNAPPQHPQRQHRLLLASRLHTLWQLLRQLPANICCIAATGGKSDTYSSVQLSNLAGLTDASAHMYSRLTDDSGGDPCEHEIAVQRDTLKCAQSLPAGLSGAMVSYVEDGKARSVAMASTGGAGRGKVAAMVADHVFFRDGKTLLYMAMDNGTRLAAWYDLVSAGAMDDMLGFMLEQHDQKH